jgi:hypothetical protein
VGFDSVALIVPVMVLVVPWWCCGGAVTVL